jgi:hypothetical protein
VINNIRNSNQPPHSLTRVERVASLSDQQHKELKPTTSLTHSLTHSVTHSLTRVEKVAPVMKARAVMGVHSSPTMDCRHVYSHNCRARAFAVQSITHSVTMTHARTAPLTHSPGWRRLRHSVINIRNSNQDPHPLTHSLTRVEKVAPVMKLWIS